MTNYRVVSVKEDHPLNQWEAYHLLPPITRAALQEGPQVWDTCHVLQTYLRNKKHMNSSVKADRATALWVFGGHFNEIEGQRGSEIWNAVHSPHVASHATMQTSGNPLLYAVGVLS
jgi:hypothetical protein